MDIEKLLEKVRADKESKELEKVAIVEKYNKKNKVKKLTQEERLLRIEELLGL